MADPGVYDRSVRIAAPRDVVFEYFVDPTKMTRWIGSTADLDPRVGGNYRLDMNGRAVARGRYVEIDPPNRVVFTWGWEAGGPPVPPGSSTVEITLVADGEGTLVRLCHRDLSVDSVPSHAEGWGHYLERLVVAASGGDPGPDPWADPPADAPIA